MTDTFARDHLPAKALWPEMRFTLPELQYPARLNCANRLLDRHVREGRGARRAVVAPGLEWSYDDLMKVSNRIAHVLTSDLGIVPGNRVLLRAANTPMLAACWLAIMKAGAIAVSTMPLYRSGELRYMIEKAAVHHALCDARLRVELTAATSDMPGFTTVAFGDGAADGLEARMASRDDAFTNADTSAEDVALIAFTSGTTGKPKAAMHVHRDILATCDTFGRHVLKASSKDLFCGSPPLGFTYGLGGALLFPLDACASTLLLEKAGPEQLIQAVADFGVTTIFTAPIAYRAMTELAGTYDVSSLHTCVSAGETLPLPIWRAWNAKTGLRIIDGIGSTEMLHIFISSPQDRIRPGSTGQVVPGYEAEVHDDDGERVAPNTVGRLAVKGPTGCRYLDDDRQSTYVRNGWNYPGDAYRMDEDGYFWYVARADDMIISAGYNISGPEVEQALLGHAGVKECAVVSKPDPVHSTNIVKAYVVLADGTLAGSHTGEELQEFVRTQIAPYKCPREIEFVAELPRTQTGKVQRFRLREKAAHD